jgi:hypothetical protein
MKPFLLVFICITLQNTMTIFDFNATSNTTNWRIVDDVVMGGRSNGDFKVNNSGYGEFSGMVSLENNGGFSMVQHTFETKKVDAFTKVAIRLKGDGKTYQFRVKTNNNDRHSYTKLFDTNGEWETIEIPFNQLEPRFRGRKLPLENYSGNQMQMIAFLIGNKKAESFKLEIERIELK